MAHVRGRDLEWTISEDVYVHNDHIEVVPPIKTLASGQRRRPLNPRLIPICIR